LWIVATTLALGAITLATPRGRVRSMNRFLPTIAQFIIHFGTGNTKPAGSSLTSLISAR
jgi:hypothetical protein